MAITEVEKEKTRGGDEESFNFAPAPNKDPICIICGAKAEFCMRGLPNNTYCRECAESYFKLLDYLDHL
jgi:hypothetical protein